VERQEGGAAILDFGPDQAALAAALDAAGEVPLPPYIRRDDGPRPDDAADYQTIFAERPGAVAAPTASLHFTPRLLAALDARGVRRATVTLHVGAGTFLPVREEDPRRHRIHQEWGEVGEEAAAAINAARAEGRRVVAIGTTALRVTETAARADGSVAPFRGLTGLYILPGDRVRAVDALVDQLPPAEIDAADAGLGLRGHAADARGLCPRDRPGLPLLLLRGWQPAVPLRPGHPGMTLRWTHSASDGAARAGTLLTAHGEVPTPVFMPVGTAGTVKAMTAEAVRSTGARMVLGNTYHLMLRPGAERVARLGGLHRMMDWPGPILTDSGGFQVMSLTGLRKMDADGVTFRSHIDGTAHRLTPERSVEIQHLLDADVTMCFDECTPFPATHAQAAESMRLSMRWAARCRAAFVPREGYWAVRHRAGQHLRRSARRERRGAGRHRLRGLRDRRPRGRRGPGGDVPRAGRDGAAAAERRAALPDGRRHAGRPARRRAARRRHVRLRDPTRSGRTGRAYTSRGVLNLRNARHADDSGPLDPDCTCPACTHHSRATCTTWSRRRRCSGPMLLTWHNIHYYQHVMRGCAAPSWTAASRPRPPPSSGLDGDKAEAA
jgi:queuine tRNA-ribosyltransferase